MPCGRTTQFWSWPCFLSESASWLQRLVAERLPRVERRRLDPAAGDEPEVPRCGVGGRREIGGLEVHDLADAAGPLAGRLCRCEAEVAADDFAVDDDAVRGIVVDAREREGSGAGRCAHAAPPNVPPSAASSGAIGESWAAGQVPVSPGISENGPQPVSCRRTRPCTAGTPATS